MVYGSVCSGIEAATVAWEPLGWKPAWFSEIDPFASAVLAHHYPDVPKLGDMRNIYDQEIFRTTHIDLLVGGTPCQSFALGGKRFALGDKRGNLALEFLKIVGEKKPRWVIWENVPGVLTSFTREDRGSQRANGENKECQEVETADFGTFLATLQEHGFGYAWRILDAQFFGVPQQRRRLFVVGYTGGDWRPPVAVLFDPK